MEIVRQVIDSNLLESIDLPESLKNRKVEITILPFDEGDKIEKIYNIRDLLGIASEYAKQGMTIDEIMEKESRAWAEAAAEKYELNRRNNG